MLLVALFFTEVIIIFFLLISTKLIGSEVFINNKHGLVGRIQLSPIASELYDLFS